MIIVDSNIYIFSESESAPERSVAIQKLKDASIKDRIGTNVIVMSEVYHHVRRFTGLEGATLRVADILNSPLVDFLDFRPETIVRATKLARDFQMRINDALIAQQAIELGAAVLTDNIRDFGKIKSLKIIPLRS